MWWLAIALAAALWGCDGGRGEAPGGSGGPRGGGDIARADSGSEDASTAADGEGAGDAPGGDVGADDGPRGDVPGADAQVGDGASGDVLAGDVPAGGRDATAGDGATADAAPSDGGALAEPDAASCGAGQHLCSGACVRDDSPTTCGTSCVPCPPAPGAHATCDGTSCGLECNAGTVLCGGTCAECPAGAGVATTRCDATRCVVASCASTHRLCNSTCAPCPADRGITGLACAPSGACVAAACDAGFRLCGDTCCAWRHETVFTGAVRMAKHEALSVTPSGLAQAVFVDATTHHLVHTWRPGTWMSELMDTQGVLVQDAVITANGTPDPHIAFNNRALSAVYAFSWGGSSWRLERVGAGVPANLIAVAADALGRPHVAAALSANGTFTVRHAFKHGASWTVEDVHSAAYSSFGANDLAIAVDASDRATIVFAEPDTQRYRTYRHDGSRWLVSGLGNARDYAGHTAAVSFSPAGEPFYSFLQGGTVGYGALLGGAWASGVVAASVGALGGGNDVVLDLSGRVHAAGHAESGAAAGLTYVLDAAPFRGLGSRVTTNGRMGYAPSVAVDAAGNASILWIDSQNGQVRYSY